MGRKGSIVKKRIFITSLAIAVAGLFLFPSVSYGDEKEIWVCENLIHYSFTFRHNEAGFWYLTGSGGSAVISDSGISENAGPLSCTGSVYLLHSIPKEAVAALKEHPDLKVKAVDPGLPSAADFSFFAYRFTGPGTMAMEIRLSPRSAGLLNGFVGGLGCPIPLVDYRFGKNVYTVYPLIGGPGLAPGFFSESDPSQINPPFIHPSQIRNASGNFASGTTVNVDGVNRNGAFYTVGRMGALSFEDAVILEFYCPLKLVFYLEEDCTGHSGEEGHGWGDFPLPVGQQEEEKEKPFVLRLHRRR